MQGQIYLVERLNYKTIKKLLGAILRKDKNRLIRYNHPKIIAT